MKTAKEVQVNDTVWMGGQWRKVSGKIEGPVYTALTFTDYPIVRINNESQLKEKQ